MTARDWFGLIVRTVGLLYALALVAGGLMFGMRVSGLFSFFLWSGIKLAISMFLLFRADVVVKHAYKRDMSEVS